METVKGAGSDPVSVRRIRESLGLTQPAFAAAFGFELGTVRQWEQGRRQPSGPALTLLRVIEMAPGIVRSAIKGR